MFSTWQVLQIIDIVSEANTEPEKLKISEKKIVPSFLDGFVMHLVQWHADDLRCVPTTRTLTWFALS